MRRIVAHDDAIFTRSPRAACWIVLDRVVGAMTEASAYCRGVDWRSAIDPEFASAIVEGGPSIGDLHVDELHDLYHERRRVPTRGPSDAVTHVEAVVPAAISVAVRIHRPKGRGDDADRAPCLLTMHGGSFIAGSNQMDDALLEHWCVALG